MQMHAYAPSKALPPPLYAKSTWVKELGLTWDYLGGIDRDEIALLVELINIKTTADGLKQRVAQGTKGK